MQKQLVKSQLWQGSACPIQLITRGGVIMSMWVHDGAPPMSTCMAMPSCRVSDWAGTGYHHDGHSHSYVPVASHPRASSRSSKRATRIPTCTDRSDELGKLIRDAASQADAMLSRLIVQACTALWGAHMIQARERRGTRPRDCG